ncbi:MAG: AarF/UbiB family protein [Acidobacteria bacterium]|nr:AarF/UbiB family protein [Acidobacteriota bacterium]MDW7984489.1 AarF/UbiB family protein [Acidobacteriota bacterium]
MRLVQIPKAYRQLRRFRQIVQVLARYGFWDVLARMGLAGPYERLRGPWRRRPTPELVHGTTPQRVRAALQELGPTFIKLGQFLSLRPDLLPVEWVHELEQLQDRVIPQPWAELRPVLDQTHAEWPAWLVELDPVPLGSASIAQVHAARTADGRAVAVKVRRPHIERLIRTDLDILAFLADLADRHIEELRPLRLPVLVAQARQVLERELDLRIEAQQIERFRRNFQDFPEIVVPAVDWTVHGDAVLVVERIEGIRIDRVDELIRHGVDPAHIARVGARALLKQVFIDGFFHADPHPGNLFVLLPGRIAVIDFGIMGTLDETIREVLADILIGVVRQDTRAVVRGLIRLGVIQKPPPPAFFQELNDFIGRYSGIPIERMSMRMVLEEVLAHLRRYHLFLATDLALMFKALLTLDSLARKLDPDLQTAEIARPFVQQLVRRRYNPLRYGRRIVQQAEQVLSMTASTPLEFEWFWQQFSRGQWPLPMEVRNLSSLEDSVQRGFHRMAWAMVIGSLLVASALLMVRPVGPVWYGIPVVGAIGWLAALLMALVLGFQALRSGRW